VRIERGARGQGGGLARLSATDGDFQLGERPLERIQRLRDALRAPPALHQYEAVAEIDGVQLLRTFQQRVVGSEQAIDVPDVPDRPGQHAR
jgi:hypothetical protein